MPIVSASPPACRPAAERDWPMPPAYAFRAGRRLRHRLDNRRVTSALLSFDDAGDRLFAALRRATAGRLPSLTRLETPPWFGVAVALLGWGLVVVFSEPWGRLWGTGQDARCY